MKKITIALALSAIAGLGAASSAHAGPTCSEFGWENHGDHVVNDYVRNGGADGGGPAHRTSAPAPGASFCLPSQSPGLHLA
jgi:hypothetical protein